MMNAIAAQRASARPIWESIPLELLVSITAVILAGALKLADLIP
ncbi:hypothetical protein [Methylobacterium sp. Leaf113]|nr:hypothetical protein [Methylobacterium sp. Leaf113]